MTDKKKLIDGKWWKIRNVIQKKINAKYDKIKDWKMDPKGYFLIRIDKKSKLIRVGYCVLKTKGNLESDHNMKYEINGKTAIEIINTIIKNKFISSLQHVGDMGIELCKAELALKYNLTYIQDKDLRIK